MGNFIIEIKAVGNHGCSREAKDGDTIVGCQRMDCVDCQAREFVQHLQSKGCSVEEATLVHWPDQEDSVKDDLLSGVRTGSFGNT